MLAWSAACASHGLARSFTTLAASRFLLGMGEGGGFPAWTKAVAEWFPPRERSTANSVVFGFVSTFHVLAFCVILLTVRAVRPVAVAAAAGQ